MYKLSIVEEDGKLEHQLESGYRITLPLIFYPFTDPSQTLTKVRQTDGLASSSDETASCRRRRERGNNWWNKFCPFLRRRGLLLSYYSAH